MKKIAVLIPCYNESKTIQKVVADYRTALPEADIYVYDNNSSDGTDVLAREAGAIVRYEHRQGKGNVIRTMFREIHADAYLMIDGDDTYPAEYARQMVDLVLNDKVDMVIGDRLSSTYFEENKRPFHNMGNVLVRKLVNRFFHGDITDIMTGYLCSGILALLSVILFVPVLMEFSHTGLVPRFPTLIVSGFIMITAILLFCCGLILDTQTKQSRQNFEIQLNILTYLANLSSDQSDQ